MKYRAKKKKKREKKKKSLSGQPLFPTLDKINTKLKEAQGSNKKKKERKKIQERFRACLEMFSKTVLKK